MAHTIKYFPATKCIIFTLAIISTKIGLNSAAGTCPGFPGYCSEAFPGSTCVVVCSRGRPNVPLCQSDGTWTDIPRCVEHDPGVEEQIPGRCPGIPGYCSDGFIGTRCNFRCPVGADIDSVCSGDGTWIPYPTCAGDLRETQDGCNGCPGSLGAKRNRTAENILGINDVIPDIIEEVPRSITRPPKKQQDFGRNVRPSFAGNIIVGKLPDSKPKSVIPPQQTKSKFVPNLAAAGLRTQPPRTTPRPTPAPVQPTQQPFARFNQFKQQQASRQQPTVQQQQQPRKTSTSFQQFGRPSTQQAPRQTFTGQQTFTSGNTNTGVSGPRQSSLPQQPRRQGGFSSQQLDIIKNGLSRLNGNNNFAFNRQQGKTGLSGQTSSASVQFSQNNRQSVSVPTNQFTQNRRPGQQMTSFQQPRQQVQQPRQPVQQPRQPVQQPRQPTQQTPVQRPSVPQPQPTRRPAPTRAPVTAAPAPAPRPAPAPAPAAPKAASDNGPKQTALTAFQRAILKNAGVKAKDIPKTIAKVEKPKINEPRVVQFLAEEPVGLPPPPPGPAGDAFFGPFEVFQPGQPGAGGPLPDLRAFPAIPEAARSGAPLGAPPGAPNQFGIFETINLKK